MLTLDDRLQTALNIWLATARPDGRPHLAPIWFVMAEGRCYICTGGQSVKARNLRANPRVALAVEDGTNAFVVEGAARPVTASSEVIGKFKAKYNWDITADPPYDTVFEIEFEKQVMGK